MIQLEMMDLVQMRVLERKYKVLSLTAEENLLTGSSSGEGWWSARKCQ